MWDDAGANLYVNNKKINVDILHELFKKVLSESIASLRDLTMDFKYPDLVQKTFSNEDMKNPHVIKQSFFTTFKKYIIEKKKNKINQLN